MMQKRVCLKVTLFILLGLLLAGCQGTPTPTTQPALTARTARLPAAATSTPEPTATQTPQSTITPSRTNTPEPSSASARTIQPTQMSQQANTLDSSIAPTSRDELEDWLTYLWNVGTDLEDVVTTLEQAGWTTSADWKFYPTAEKSYRRGQSVDLDGDGANEWLISILTGECVFCCVDEGPGELWVIGGTGLVYQLYSKDDLWSAPIAVEVEDLTGDGMLDAVAQSVLCGAHTIRGTYHVISGHHGHITSVIQRGNELEQAADNLRHQIWDAAVDWSEPGIEIISPYDAVTITYSNTFPSLILQGGYYGSVGAGPHRAMRETWSWNGKALELTDIQPSESQARIHALFDANFAFSRGFDDTAKTKYERVIEDEELNNDAWIDPTDIYNDSRQFAAFRLVLLHLQAGNTTDAIKWSDWLHQEYPSQPLTEAAALLIDSWEETNDLGQSCAIVTSWLNDHPGSTGILFDTGYANPSLTAKNVCPLE